MFVAEIVDAQLEASGFPPNDEDHEEYYVFLVEAIAATVSRRKGYDHPMHDLIMNYVTSPVDEPPVEVAETTSKPRKSRKKKASDDKETVKTE